MNETSIRRYTEAELRRRARSGESRTDTARCEAMSDKEVEQAIGNDPDWEGVSPDWHENAEAVMPKAKVPVSIRLDADLLEELRASGRGWQTRVNAVLRAYMNAKKAATRR